MPSRRLKGNEPQTAYAAALALALGMPSCLLLSSVLALEKLCVDQLDRPVHVLALNYNRHVDFRRSLRC